jgi:hypothetical protein
MPSRQPPLSIGLPVYNGARYLRETLDSILSQSFGDFELIISDNASSDATGEIAQEAARADARVRYTRNPINIGAAGNFNRVFQLASAPLFKWACADDCLAEGFLDAAVRELGQHREVVLCYGGITLIDGDGRELGRCEQRLDLREAAVEARFRRARMHTGLLNVLQGVMRSDALHRSAPQGAYPGSDEVLVAELSLKGRIHEIAAPMLFRRMHPMAASAATSVEQQLTHLDPNRRLPFASRNWGHAVGHLRAIGRAPVGLHTKLKLAASVARDMIRIRDQLGTELIEGLRRLISRREDPPARGGARRPGPPGEVPK